MTDTTVHRSFPLLEVAQIALHPDNLRDEYRGIEELAASIAEAGMLHPLIVVPVDQVDGHQFPAGITHVVVDGHRRLLAAQSRPEIQHVLCDLRPDLASARDAQRTMAVTGMAREDLTARERAKAVQLLLDLGWTQAQVARSTGQKPAEVRTAKAAAQLSEAVAVEYAQGLTIADMAALVEFQDDRDAVAAITQAAREGRTDHAVERARSDRTLRAEKAALAETYKAGGFAVYLDHSADVGVSLGELVDVTVEQHEQCAGRAVLVVGYWPGQVDVRHRCADPDKFGHARHAWSHGGPKPEPTEKDKAARKQLLERNKDMAAAAVVRRRFLSDVRESKIHAAAQSAFALKRILHRDPAVVNWLDIAYARSQSMEIYVEVVGVDNPDDYLRSLPAHKAAQALWMQVVTAIEHALPKDAHRWEGDRREQLAVYLEHLVLMGYQPCATEQLVIGEVRKVRATAERREAKKQAAKAAS